MTRYGIDGATLLRLDDGRAVDPRHQLVGPSSLRSEALQLLLTAVRTGERTEQDALEVHERMTALKIRVLGDRVSRRTAWRIAMEQGRDTLRDAEHLAVVRLQADALVTVDPDLAVRASPRSFRGSVHEPQLRRPALRAAWQSPPRVGVSVASPGGGTPGRARAPAVPPSAVPGVARLRCAAMERAEVLQVLREKAVEMLEVEADQVQEDKSFVDDLQVDSLSLVELTMELEDTLGVELPEEELADVTTIGGFVDVILAKKNAQ